MDCQSRCVGGRRPVVDWKGGVQARLRLPLFFAVEGSVDDRRDTFGATTARDVPVQLSALLYVFA
jgi:hypothetical protein